MRLLELLEDLAEILFKIYEELFMGLIKLIQGILNTLGIGER